MPRRSVRTAGRTEFQVLTDCINLAEDTVTHKTLSKLEKIWTPGNASMKELKRSGSCISDVFCSFKGQNTSTEEARGISTIAYNERNMDDYSNIIQIRVNLTNTSLEDHCVMLPMRMGTMIMDQADTNEVFDFIYDRMSFERGTMATFCPVKLEEGFGLICMDYTETTVHLFSFEPDQSSFLHKVEKFVTFCNDYFYPIDALPEALPWKLKMCNLHTNAPCIKSCHSAPAVCVLMDILSQSVGYSEVKTYMAPKLMREINAKIFCFMLGFHYS
jgi:hypothetical protein